MNTKIFTILPQEAKNIRIEVFMKEQGFENEFDEIDTISHHIVVFDEGKPIGTCRFFKENNHYTIGRVAVLKKYRNLSIPWWRSHPIHENRATESIWTEPCNPLLRATKSTKRATSA